MAFFTYIHAKFLLKSEQNPKLCCKFANKKMCVFDKFDQIKKWNLQFAVVPLLSKFPYTRTQAQALDTGSHIEVLFLLLSLFY